jgi:hypothetical protein
LKSVKYKNAKTTKMDLLPFTKAVGDEGVRVTISSGRMYDKRVRSARQMTFHVFIVDDNI